MKNGGTAVRRYGGRVVSLEAASLRGAKLSEVDLILRSLHSRRTAVPPFRRSAPSLRSGQALPPFPRTAVPPVHHA